MLAPDAITRECLSCAWFRLGDTVGLGYCRLHSREAGQHHQCGAYRSTALHSLNSAVAKLRHLLLMAAAHPTWPTDATILSAEAVREVAEQWREAAAALSPAVACVAQRLAAELDTLAAAAERAAPYLPTPSEDAA